jgi:hypothetical protein
MPKKIPAAGLAVLAAASLAVSLFVQFLLQLPGFSIFRHEFRPSLPSLAALAVLFFLMLTALWILTSGVVARRLSLPGRDVAQSWIALPFPLLILAAAPIIPAHYIGREDAWSRALLLLAGAVAAVGCLAWVLFVHLKRQAKDVRCPACEGYKRLKDRRKTALFFLAALVALNAGSVLLVCRGVTFSGDEPHYLLMTRSLLGDGDLDLANNYAARDYRAYMQVPAVLDPHVVGGRKPGGAYSFHSPGTAFVLLPFYALGSLFGQTGLILVVRFGMTLIGAFFVLQVRAALKRETGDDGTADALALLTLLATPVFFYSFHVYPEIIVAAASLLAFRIFRAPESLTRGRLLAAGLLAAAPLWFHALKYIFIIGPLLLFGVWTIWKKGRKAADFAALLVPFAALTAGYFVFQSALYGSASLSTVSWKGSLGGGETWGYLKSLLTDIPLRFRTETLAGYFLDQKDGLLFYAPVWLFAALGLIEAARRKAQALLWLLFIAAPYVLVSAFLTQRTGYAPQARPLVAVFWVFPLLVAHYVSKEKPRPYAGFFRTAAAASLVMTALLLAHPPALYQETTQGTTERAGALFTLLGNLHFQVSDTLPSYSKSAEGSWLPNILWPAALVLFLAGYFVKRRAEFGTRTVPFPETARHLPLRLRARTNSREFDHVPIRVGAAAVLLAAFFVCFVLYPRPVLSNPTRVDYPTGEKLLFWSLSRVARQTEPGVFLLPQDGRSYIFTFQAREPLQALRLEFGSAAADDDIEVRYFDEPVFAGRTSGGTKSVELASPPAYAFKGTSLYWVTIAWRRAAGPRPAEAPCAFILRPVS